MKYESLCIPLCMGREGEGFFFFRAEWVSQIEESLSGCRAVGVARWFSKKGSENYPATGGCFSFSRNCFLSIRGWTHFYPVNKHYSPDDSLLTKKKSPHLLPKISLTSPIFFFSQGRDSDHLPVVSAPLSRARQSEAEIMASPGPRRFARGGEGVAFHLETVRAILVFHYIRVRILLPLRPCIIFP